MNLGEKIRQLRLRKGLTQTDLGKKIGVEKSTISMWENDKAPVPKIKMRALSEILGEEINSYIYPDSNSESYVYEQEYSYGNVHLDSLKIKIKELEIIRVGLIRDLMQKDEVISDLRGNIQDLRNQLYGHRQTGQSG